MLPATPTPPQHNSLRLLILRRLPSPSLQTPPAQPPGMSPTPSPSQKTSPVSQLITSPLPAAANKTSSFSGSGDTYSIVVTPTDATQAKATSLLMSMPVSPPMLPATATSTASQFTRPLIQGTFPLHHLRHQRHRQRPCHLYLLLLRRRLRFLQLITSPLPAAANKTAPSPVRATPTRSLLPQQMKPKHRHHHRRCGCQCRKGSSSGHANTAATQFTQAFDTQAPSVSISSDTTRHSHRSPSVVTTTTAFSFSEEVSGFTADHISVTGGSKQNGSFSGSGDTYSIVVAPTDDIQTGTITVDVDAGVATDVAGNSQHRRNTIHSSL